MLYKLIALFANRTSVRAILIGSLVGFCSNLLAEEVSLAQEASSDQILTQSKEDLKKPIVLQDLAYGNILFEYYRGNILDALNAILVAQKRGLLTHHSQSARLLSGVIYLDLGMIARAKNIFDELLTEDDLKSELLSQLEFYLGKIHYRQSDYQEATFRLKRSVDFVEPDLKDDACIMLSNMALYRKDLESARQWLSLVRQDTRLVFFTRYNLGISFLREENIQQAAPLLNDIYGLTGEEDKRDYEKSIEKQYEKDKTINSLQDKARVALAYYYLSNKNYTTAREHFLKIRLSSLHSNKALLGMGWSYLNEGAYNKALSYWLELQKRDIRDIAVQESLLAVPFAYQKLSSMQSALDNYLLAAEKFQQQISFINQIMLEIDQSELIEKFIKKITDANAKFDEITVQDSQLLDDKFDYYLFELISQHQFNEKFKNYQKLGKLSTILSYWKEQLPLFDSILQTNQQRFEERIPKTESYLAEGSILKYKRELIDIKLNMLAVEYNQKLHVLANEQELKIISRINRVLKSLAKIPADKITNEQKLKINRAQGIMRWHMERNRPERLWDIKRQAVLIEEMLEEASVRKQALFNAREIAEGRFAGFKEGVSEGTQKLLALRNKIDLQAKNQEGELKALIKTVLARRRSVLENFLLQADLSVARMHEKSFSIKEAK